MCVETGASVFGVERGVVAVLKWREEREREEEKKMSERQIGKQSDGRGESERDRLEDELIIGR